jgi:proteasome assembly chaperone 3
MASIPEAMLSDMRPDKFPAVSKLATGLVGGIPTQAQAVSFSDTFVLTVSQDGQLSQWVCFFFRFFFSMFPSSFQCLSLTFFFFSSTSQRRAQNAEYQLIILVQVQVPFGSENTGIAEQQSLYASSEMKLLPPTALTPRTLLGGRGDRREVVSQVYATHVAGQLALRDPTDHRTLVFGLGLRKGVLDDYCEGDNSHDGGERHRGAHFDLIELLQQVM